MRSLRGQRGQAATDYVALLAMLAVLLGAAVAVAAAGAPGVTNAVIAQFRRALCIVTGSTCPAEGTRPCVVAASREHRHLAANVSVFRLDDDHVLLRERLSDGTYRLTIVEHTGAGVQLAIGAHGRVRTGSGTVRVGGQARLAILGVFGDGRVFHARDRREADRTVRALMRRELPVALDRPYRVVRGLLGGDDGPRPDEEFFDGGLKALGDAGVGRWGVSADAKGLAEAALGVRRDRRTGEVTVYLRAERGGEALASAALGAAAGALKGDAVLGLVYDRHRRPVALSLFASGALRGGVGLPPVLAGLLGREADAAGGGIGTGRIPTAGRRWELDARLDLADPAVAAAWDAYRRAPASPAAIRALGEQLRSRARLDARTYRTSVTGRGLAGGAAVGVGLGAEIERTLEQSQLTAAASRPPGGVWEQRTDCVPSRA